MDKEVYKLVDALEETIDFWRVDGDMFRMPLENTYIPVRNTIMKKPNLLDQDLETDELGYRYNDYENDKTMTRRRFHPLEQLNPLRGNRMGPGHTGVYDMYKNRREPSRESIKYKPNYYQWRRLSKVKSRNFSTWNNAY